MSVIAKPLRCLIVEDAEDDALLMLRQLRGGNYDVTWERVDTPEAMRAALERQPWDLVLSDYKMPHFSGLAALELFRASGLDLPFIIVSGTIGEDTAVGMMKAGAHDYLMKGRLAHLMPAMERELRNAVVRREGRQAEESLRRREAYLTAILENQPGLVWLKDMAGRFQAVNQAFADSCGQASPADLAGKTDLDIWPPKLAEKYRADDASVVRNEVSVIVEEPIVDRGKTTWFETFKTPVRDEKDEVIGTTGFARDITERKRAEAELSASEVRYRRLFEAARDGILILDAETGMVVEVNPFLVQMLGYSREIFLGKKIWELGFFKDIMANQDHFAELQQKEYIHYEDMPLETSDGRRIEVEFVSHVYDVNYQKVIQCNIRNITKRKRAEAELQQSQQRLSLHVEQTPLAVIEFDLEGQVRQWNPAAVAIFGFSREEAIGQDMTFIVPAAIHGQIAGVWSALVSQHGGNRSTNENITKDGRTIQCEWFSTPLVDSDGQTIGVASLIQDVSERKQAEARIAEQLGELSRWHDAMLGREDRVIEVKNEVNALRARLGEPPSYRSAIEGREQ